MAFMKASTWGSTYYYWLTTSPLKSNITKKKRFYLDDLLLPQIHFCGHREVKKNVRSNINRDPWGIFYLICQFGMFLEDISLLMWKALSVLNIFRNKFIKSSQDSHTDRPIKVTSGVIRISESLLLLCTLNHTTSVQVTVVPPSLKIIKNNQEYIW